MKPNIGKTDRLIRLSLAAILVVLAFSGLIASPGNYMLFVPAGILLLTSLVRFCPLYTICGFSSTCPLNHNGK